MTDKTGPGDAAEPTPAEEVPPDRFSIKVQVRPETLTELLSRFELDVGDRPHVEPAPDGTGTLYAFAPEVQIREIEAAGYVVEVGDNVSEIGRQRMGELAVGDRFEGGRIPPTGLGEKPGRGRGPDTGAGPQKGGQAR
jgi:hypothetical protein